MRSIDVGQTTWGSIVKQIGLTGLLIACLLLLAVQGNANDISTASVAVEPQQEELVASNLLVEEVGACGADYGCSVSDIASSESANHEDLLADLANSLGQDD